VAKAKERKKPRGRLLRRALLIVSLITGWGVFLYWQADDSLRTSLRARTVNDITQLNPIQVGRVVAPTSVEHISELLRNSDGAVSIGGARCSMGGQTAATGSLHLDMRQMNKLVSLSQEQRTATVQAGMRWRDLQEQIDPHGLAVKIMQTYSTFTVGGTLSVNAHGRYMGLGPVVQSVRSIKLVLASGEVVQASRDENAELFWGAIGGYGGLGVIAEATLDLVPNEKVKRVTETMEATEYAAFFREQVRSDPNVIFHNADLHPPHFETMRSVSWVRTEDPVTVDERLIARDEVYKWTPLLINKVGLYPLGGAFREHVLEPLFYRSNAVTWRNHEASYDVRELEPQDRSDSTYVLREYFLPAAKLDEFVPTMRDIFREHEVDIVNVSIRYATSDPGTLLAWARGETFAFVVYYRQDTTPEAIAAVGEWSRELVDAVIAAGGTYYLPYQNHATRQQFLLAYPRAAEFFAQKAKVDPKLRFQNAMWEAYGPQPHAELRSALAELDHYRKPEGQALLTVPEWYLVFNPVEYAEHLRAGKPGDSFPLVESVSEYWSLYKRVLRATDGVYPANSEYLTMLRVIGVSTTVEYLVKAAYEATIGRLARVLSDGSESLEEQRIAEAHTAYAELIFQEPWYAFRFLPWVAKIWNETSLFGSNFIRRTERKLAFSLEFSVKAAYAELIGFAAGSAYEAPQEFVYAAIEAPAGSGFAIDPRVKVVRSFADGTHIVSIPRWGAFTEIVPKLAERDVRFLEIAGNDDIALSVIKPSNTPELTGLGQRMFSSKLVSDPTRVRTILFVPVRQLSHALRTLSSKGAQLEHIYDY
jgi:FAD/FMN-containing dehydrogenase